MKINRTANNKDDEFTLYTKRKLIYSKQKTSKIQTKDFHINTENNIEGENDQPEFPVKDYEKLTLREQLEYDKRPFWKYIKEKIFPEHIFINIFFLNTLFTPRYIRIIRCFIVLGVMFGFNAMLYQDDDIKARGNLDLDPNVIITLI